MGLFPHVASYIRRRLYFYLKSNLNRTRSKFNFTFFKTKNHFSVNVADLCACLGGVVLVGNVCGTLMQRFCALVCFTRGHRGTGRSAVAAAAAVTAAAAAAAAATASPLGTPAHSKAPAAPLTREGQAPRARVAAGGAGYRPPLLAVTHESYNDYVSPTLFVPV